jgi:hypothetical protein
MKLISVHLPVITILVIVIIVVVVVVVVNRSASCLAPRFEQDPYTVWTECAK